MLVLAHLDWNGTDERLKELDEAWMKACEKTEGAEYLGRHMPWNKKFHWTNVFKIKDISTWDAVRKNLKWNRNYNEVTHGAMEVYE